MIERRRRFFRRNFLSDMAPTSTLVFSERIVPFTGAFSRSNATIPGREGETGPPLNSELAIAAQHVAENIESRTHSELTDNVEDLFAVSQTYLTVYFSLTPVLPYFRVGNVIFPMGAR